MGHNPLKVVLGGTLSSLKDVGNLKGDIAAGLGVREKADGTGSVLAADGELKGISLGRDMSGAGYSAVAMRGNKVPVQLTAAYTPIAGTPVFLDNTTGRAKASATDATAVNAVFRSGVLAGVPEGGGAEVAVALIDFPGGL